MDSLIIKDADFDVTSEDFAKAFILRRFCGTKAIALYVELRARGFDTLSSFFTAFGDVVTGHPDTIGKAAAAFETSTTFKSALHAALERIGPKTLQEEYESRASEISAFTRSMAHVLPVEPEPVSAFTAAQDEQAFNEHLKRQGHSRAALALRNAPGLDTPIQPALKDGYTVPRNTRMI